VSPVRYELGFYIAEDDILHSHRRENLKSYTGDVSSVIKSLSISEYDFFVTLLALYVCYLCYKSEGRGFETR
jgi:hypothetical protein